MAKSYTPRSKMPALITYIVAVVFLILGLTLPLGIASFTGGGIDFGKMPFMQLTGALASFGLFAGGSLPFGTNLAPVFSFPVNAWGYNLNIGAALLLLYALITVFAVILLIPACIVKKKSAAARKIAVVMELLALVVLLPLCALAFTNAAAEWNITVFAAFVITALMLIVQSIIYFGKSGVIKTVTFIVSALTVAFAIANVADNLPFLKSPINSLIELITGNRPFETAAGLYSLGDTVFFGSTLIKAALISPSSLAWNVSAAIVNYIALSLSVLVCLNLLLDMLGLGKRTNKFMLVCNNIRYIVQFILIIALYIAVFASLGNFGLCLYILTLFSLVQFIIAIARYCRYKKAAARAEEHDEDADLADSDEDYAFGAEADAAPAKTATPSATGAVVETRDLVYNVNTIYNGPSDNFIRKLTNEEKVEFARVFLERSTGNLTMIPDYIVGGENSKFFSSVFIYLSHVRSAVTDGLMNKLYEEVAKQSY